MLLVILVLIGSSLTVHAGQSPPSSAPPHPEHSQPPRTTVGPPDDGTAEGDGRTDDGQEPQGGQPADVEELRRRIDVLAAEIEQLRSGETEVELTEERRRSLGLAPSAAATYRKRQGVSFAGYGEMLYENFSDRTESHVSSPKSPQLDFLRAILYTGYRFNGKFIFNSEIEVEHATEISVEFAYLDYLLNDQLTVRGGMLLVPLGLINEFHEPTVFIGARRPETERRIIPTTWHENGAGLLGSAGRFSYRAYLVNGLDASGFSSDGLRGGRQGGAEARAENMAFAGRLDITPLPGAFAGVGVYRGGSAQGRFGELDATTTIAELHGQIQMRGLDLRALYARASLDEAADLNAARQLTSSQAIAEVMHGGYVQVGYNVLSQSSSRMAAMPYYRFEKIDTQAEMPAGYLPDPARDAMLHTLGLEFRPIYNIVVKTDYQWIGNEAGTGRNQFNINLGYAF